MNRQERLKEVFKYLKRKGFIETQKDLAEAMGSTQPNVSGALNGNEALLTDNFLMRLNNAYDNIFNMRWLLNGEDEMLNEALMNQNGDGGERQQGRAGHDLTQTNNSKELFEGFINALNGQQAVTMRSMEQISEAMKQTNKALDEIAEHRKQTDMVLELLRTSLNNK